MLIRFILIVLLIWVVLVVVKSLRRLRQVRQDRQGHTVTHKQVVQCAYCDVYVPKDEALLKHDDYFCCPEHMNKIHKADI